MNEYSQGIFYYSPENDENSNLPADIFENSHEIFFLS